MINKKQSHLIKRISLSILLVSSPSLVTAQYFGTGTKQREEVIIDFSRFAEEEEKAEDKNTPPQLMISRNIPTALVERCQQELSPPVVNVILINDHGHILYNDKSLLELSQRESTFRSNQKTTYTFSSTTARNTYLYEIDAQSLHEGRYSCLSPRVNLTIKQERQETEIANEIAPRSCLEESVLNHEAKRIKINNEIAKKSQIKNKKEIEDALTEMGIIYGNERQIKDWLSSVVDKTIAPIVRRVEGDLRSAHVELDTIESSDYFLYVCEGQGLDIIQRIQQRN